jgi:uncharacterized protein
MAQLLEKGRAPSDVMASIGIQDAERGPYQPCSCGSGRKFRFCHGSKGRSPHNVALNLAEAK